MVYPSANIALNSISVYIQEETSLIQDEMASLERLNAKLEKEIQRANKTQGPYMYLNS